MKPSPRLLAPLTILLIALAVAGCGSDTETVTKVTTVIQTTPPDTTDTVTDETTTTDTTETADTATDPGPAPQALTVFQSPSGNIGCQMDSENVRCDIREKDFADPPAPSDCPLEYGDTVGVGLSGPGDFVCHGDTAIDPTSPTLAYGQSSSNGPFSCTSTESGMRCENTDSGNGFSLSRQAADTF